MDERALSIVLLVGILIALISIVWRLLAEEAKADRLKKFAAAHGFSFTPEVESNFGENLFGAFYLGDSPSIDFLSQYEGLEPFTRVSGAKVKYLHQIKDEEGGFEAFQYQYVVSTGKSSYTVFFRIASLVLPVKVPKTKVCEHGLFDGLARAVGMQDIQLEHDDFNERFLVQGHDERFVYDLLHPRMMEYLMKRSFVHVQMQNNRLVVFESGEIDESFILGMRERLRDFWDLVPEYVREDRKA